MVLQSLQKSETTAIDEQKKRQDKENAHRVLMGIHVHSKSIFSALA